MGVKPEEELESERGGSDAAPRQRGFDMLGAFSLCFASMGVAPSLSVGLLTAVPLGGPAEMIWVWFLVCVTCTLSSMAMGELASAFPQDGSVYVWSGLLAGNQWGEVAAYIAGWSEFTGFSIACAALAWSFAQCIAYCVQIVRPDSSMPDSQLVPIAIGMHLFWTLSNHLRSSTVAFLNKVGAFYLTASTLVVAIVLLSKSPERATAEFVFTQGYDCTNVTGLAPDPETGLSCTDTVAPYTIVMGLSFGAWSLLGYDAGAQVAEELQDAARAAPIGIIGCVIWACCTGTLYLLAFLFATPNITLLEVPLRDTLVEVAGQSGGLALMILVTLMFVPCGFGFVGSTSRLIAALARDGAVPRQLDRVSIRTGAPYAALWMNFGLACVLLLLPLFSTTVLVTLIGSSTALNTLAYFIPFMVRITLARKSFEPGPFSLGRWSIPVHTTAAIYNLMATIVFIWPTAFPVDASNMNWTIVIVLAVLAVGGAYWALVARQSYKGPSVIRQSSSALGGGAEGTAAASGLGG